MQPIRLFKDPRHFQIAFQTCFMIFGLYVLHWNPAWWLYPAFFITGIVTQVICEAIFVQAGMHRFSAEWGKAVMKGLPSALISSFGLSLFLKTNHIEIAVLASAVAIVSKYLIRLKGKHIFNPSALGIVVAVLFTNKAWINPGQWGSGYILLFGILTLGIIVVTRVQKLDVSLAFLFTFASLLFIRQVVYLNWPADFFVQSITTGSVLVFSFFMISDPKTTPNHSTGRIIWAMMVAAVAFYLTTFHFVNGAPVYALVMAQLLIPVFDLVFKSKHFEWVPIKGPVKPAIS